MIRPYSAGDESAVITLWQRCDMLHPRNNPKTDIERKLSVNPELFLVGLIESKVVATAMGGYEGHRGWVNYLAVYPAYRRRGFGRQIMAAAEKEIKDKGCPKINLQIRKGNLAAAKLYDSLGYNRDEVFCMGKRLVEDEPF
jgi:ribosomal protein S18 acetylase RimI-like enzyme